MMICNMRYVRSVAMYVPYIVGKYSMEFNLAVSVVETAKFDYTNR